MSQKLPGAASAAAKRLMVRSVSDEPRLELRGLAPVEAKLGTGIGTGDARRMRGSDADPFLLGLPGQFASISGSEMGTDVPLLDTVDDASESGNNGRIVQFAPRKKVLTIKSYCRKVLT